MLGSTGLLGRPVTVTRIWWYEFLRWHGGSTMHPMELASSSDGPAILRMTAMVGGFTPGEANCVEELWSAYRDRGEIRGWVPQH